MASITDSDLLKDKDILNEINIYKWLESERIGTDIGFERATREWMNKYSTSYLARHPNKTALLWIKSLPVINILNKDISSLR